MSLLRWAANNHAQYLYVGFSRRNKIPRVAVHTTSEKVIRFRHPNYDPDRAQKLTSSSMSRHLSTRNISSKSIHAFLSNLANRQTDRQTPAIASISPQSRCHSAPVCEILSKSDRPRQKMTSCRFSEWRNSVILDFRGFNNWFFEKPMYDILLYVVNKDHSSKLVSFRENRLFAFWRQDPRLWISAILDLGVQ